MFPAIFDNIKKKNAGREITEITSKGKEKSRVVYLQVLCVAQSGSSPKTFRAMQYAPWPAMPVI